MNNDLSCPLIHASCQRCKHHNNPEQPCQKLIELCKHTDKFAGISVDCLIHMFLSNPISSRTKPYSCDEIIAFCLLNMDYNMPHIFVPSYQQGYLIDTNKKRSEEEIAALLELMGQDVNSLNSTGLVSLEQKYELEIKTTQELYRLKVLDNILCIIKQYKKFYNLKTGTGAVRRVREDMRYFIENVAAKKGINLNIKKLPNCFIFFAKQCCNQQSNFKQ
jgi:hypothetical protein